MVVISRRRVLQSVPVTVVAVALPTGTAAAAKAPADPLSRSRWASLVGSSFTAKSATSTWSARLSAIDDLPGSPGSDRRYALRFTSTVETAGGHLQPEPSRLRGHGPPPRARLDRHHLDRAW